MAGFRELIVKIGADTGGLEGGLTGAISKLAGLGTVATAGAAAAVAAIAAVGAAAFKVGIDFEAANRTIRAGTGATGEAFEDLKDSAKTVFTQVDDSIGEVSQTLADLNTATGATGPTLENLTAQLLDLSDVGVGFSGKVETLTRVYGDWGIAIEDASEANDYLFKVAQSTGAGVDDLASKVVQFGAPLRQLGFDFEQSAALMGKFQQEGVNTETIMSGLRIGLANLSKAGGDVPANFQAAMEAIKAAGTTAEANAIAFEVFGSRAGADMSAAVREGRFSIEELVATLETSEETIASVAKETETFGEKMSQLGNKAMAALEPLGTFLVDVLASALDDVIAVWDAWAIGLDVIGELAAAAGIQLWDFSGGVKSIGEAIRDFLIGYVTKSIEALVALSKTLNSFPIIGGSFDKTIAIMEKGLDRLNGIVAKTADSVGTPNKPTSFAGSVKGAEVVVFDLEKALKASAEEAKDFEKGLEDARKRGVEDFTTAIKSGAIPAVEGLDRVSGTTAMAVVSDVLAMTGGMDPLIIKIEDIPKRTKDVEEAFASLESKSVADLQALYNAAEHNFDLIQASGEATPRQISEAWRNELEAQKALLVAQGKDLSAEEQKILSDLNAKLKTGTEEMKGTWSQFATDVAATISGLGQQLFSDLLEGKFSLSTVTSALGQIKDAFATALFKPVTDAMNKFITETVDKLIGKLTGPGGLTGALDKVFGGGSLGGGGGDWTNTTGGPSVPAGGGWGGAKDAIGGLAGAGNPINMITGAISAGSDVFSNFQFAAMNKSLDLIETATRRTDIGITQTGGIIDLMHGYLAADAWKRFGDFMGRFDRLEAQLWDIQNNLITALGSITVGVSTVTTEVVQAVESVEAAGAQQAAVFDARMQSLRTSVERTSAEDIAASNTRTGSLLAGLVDSYDRGQDNLSANVADSIEYLSRDMDEYLRATQDRLGQDVNDLGVTVDQRIENQTRDLEAALAKDLDRLGSRVGDDLAALGDEIVGAIRRSPVRSETDTPRGTVRPPMEPELSRTSQGILEIMRATDDRLVFPDGNPAVPIIPPDTARVAPVRETDSVTRELVSALATRPVEIRNVVELDGQVVGEYTSRYLSTRLY